jgi:methionyl-tRNA formyltransferase
MERQLQILYMGTPEFAVAPLESILKAGYQVKAVVTAPDKPAGRGRNLRFSPVKEFALQNNIPVLQPWNLKDPEFICALQDYQANIQVVVAFRMLPEVVWNMPEYGTINLHASLLPQYRGAAPINWAIINGETETGITTFLLTHEIDTGKILYRETCQIYPDDDAEALHDRLKLEGARLLVRTLESIRRADFTPVDQEQLIGVDTLLKKAPKIFKPDCAIHWDSSGEQVHNLVRGLSPVPGAYFTLCSPESVNFNVKVFRTSFERGNTSVQTGVLDTDGKTHLSVGVPDGIIRILDLQLEGRKRLTVPELLRGFNINNTWRAI